MLQATAPVEVITFGLVEQVPQQVEFSIDLTKLESSDASFLEELAKPHQFGSTPTLVFKSDSVEKRRGSELSITGNWHFDGQSKPCTVPAQWSMDGSQMKLYMSPLFRLRDFRPMPKDAPKQTIDPRFQIDIKATLAPVQ